MKKALLLFSVLFPLLAFSQDFLFDKPRQDGTRIFGTNYFSVRCEFGDLRPVGFSLNAHTENDKLKCFYLGLKLNSAYDFKLPKGGMLLIKCADSTIVECKHLYDDALLQDLSPAKGQSGYVEDIIGMYSIRAEDVIRICDNGIAKVRIETGYEPINRAYTEKRCNKIALEFQKAFKLMRDGLLNPTDIRTGF